MDLLHLQPHGHTAAVPSTPDGWNANPGNTRRRIYVSVLRRRPLHLLLENPERRRTLASGNSDQSRRARGAGVEVQKLESAE